MSETPVLLTVTDGETEVLVDAYTPTEVVIGGSPEVVLDVAGDLVVDETAVILQEGPKGDPGPAGSDADATELIAAHAAAPEPHPSYDDMPTLRYIFENGLI